MVLPTNTRSWLTTELPSSSILSSKGWRFLRVLSPLLQTKTPSGILFFAEHVSLTSSPILNLAFVFWIPEHEYIDYFYLLMIIPASLHTSDISILTVFIKNLVHYSTLDFLERPRWGRQWPHLDPDHRSRCPDLQSPRRSHCPGWGHTCHPPQQCSTPLMFYSWSGWSPWHIGLRNSNQ